MLKILYEDDRLFAFFKPYGVVVNRSESVLGETMQDLVEAEFPNMFIGAKDDVFRQRSGMVHRLDKDTSGVILWAKTAETMYDMMKLFKERQVHKTYLALVYGNFDPSTGDVRLPLARHPLDRRRFTVTPLGKESLTEFKRLGKYGHMGDAYSLMELRPVTGRTHQLRVHMSWLGFPIVGDPLYAGPRLLAKSSKVCQRLFLHARHINFIHPYSGENVSVSAELDETLEQAMECLCIN